MTRTLLVLTAVTALGLACPAGAQNALDSGDGNALDGNLSTYGGRFNQPQAVPNFNARNLLVTGNVAGGRGFRGTVGYTAEFDFRGETGSDDLFVERANSAFSAPSFWNAGRSMEQLRFGQYLNEVEYQSATRGATVSNFQFQRYVDQDMLDARLALDKVAISSTTSALYESAADSRIFGMLQDPDGKRFAASASSLMGVQMTPMEHQVQIIGLTSYDMARTVDDLVEGREVRRLGDPFDSSFQNLQQADGGADPITGRVEPDVQQYRWIEPGYEQIMETVARGLAGAEEDEPLETTPQLLESLDERFEALRQQLAEMHPEDEADAAAEDDGEAADEGQLPRLPELPAPEVPALELPELPALPETPDAIEEIAPVLRHGQRVERFADPADQGRFNELMASGEELLRDGEYFWAERRFERALRFAPGNPYAMAGVGHSTLGAGLYVPAGLSLRRLLTTNPEMIDVAYGPDLLPSRARLTMAVQKLQELVRTVRRDRELHAFLLAYIGHQLDDDELITEGLGAMDAADPLRELLGKVWQPTP